MTFPECMQLKERAEAAGIGDDRPLARSLHYLQSQEVATRHFQAYVNEMEASCKNISKNDEEFDFLGWHFHFRGDDSGCTPRYVATMGRDGETRECDYDCMFGAGFDDIH